MNQLHRLASSESFSEVGETCPAVDRAMEAATETIKQQTTALRGAHIAALERALKAEDEAADLRQERDDLLERVADLEKEIRLLEARGE